MWEGMGVWRCLHHRLRMCGGGLVGSQTWGAKQLTDQPSDYPSHLPMHQHTNHTTTQHESDGGLLDVLKRKFAICWNEHVLAVVQTIGLNATGHRRNILLELNRNEGRQKSKTHTCSGGNL